MPTLCADGLNILHYIAGRKRDKYWADENATCTVCFIQLKSIKYSNKYSQSICKSGEHWNSHDDLQLGVVPHIVCNEGQEQKPKGKEQLICDSSNSAVLGSNELHD